MKLLFSIAFFIVSAMFSQLNAQEDDNTVSFRNLYFIERPNYSIAYPSNWEESFDKTFGVEFILFSPLASKEDKFRENVNLLIQDLSNYDLDLDKYTELSVNQIKTMVTNSVLIESNRISKGENDNFQKIIYSGDQGAYKLKFEQYYFVKDKKAYVLTFTGEQSEFDKYKESAEETMNSFVIKQNK
jgi:serine/threonine-protein kinase